jgi:hypothetical protein
MSSITPNLELPLLVVDAAHWQRPNENGAVPLEYNIHNHSGFLLSTQGYEFELPEKVGFQSPNIIQLIMGKEQLYAMAYEADKTLYTVNAENLVAMYGSPKFKHFEKDQKVIVAIGHLSPVAPGEEQPKFIVLWVGVVNIA